jgi:pimeloyl-ACP methyl ester carboxylesterase
MMQSWIELDESGISLPRRYDAVSAAFSLFTPETLNNDDDMALYVEGSAAMPAWEGPGRSGQHHADVAYDNRLGALSGVRVPAMVIAFASDMVTPPHLGKEVADAIPGCRYVEIEGAGHAGPVEKPDEVNAALLKFFAEV